ncbi:hypothetical protein BS47DRAFT_1305075 [Hydnum rufescens UP504]|uniref:DUF6570 domain-containing protein n=1 Tax=Hydnum rufescens UP504 TaxID=1448309 RepID=A0A9P6AIS4_9AGAM|nr:hypothetical protein BS47DRAFT_1305075 [Hydnum rufescens UP504]
MISRHHAKCFIIHLKEDKDVADKAGNGIPSGPCLATTQQGMKGHVIVFPQEPEKLTRSLPPPMEEVITPMCVIFVGSAPPTKEWMEKHARPLIVQHEKVRAALVWLKTNNPLYSDIIINHAVVDSLPTHSIAPVNIDTHAPSPAEDAQGSQYDGVPSSTQNEESILQNVVVSNIDMHDISSNQMHAAAMQHLKKGGGYIEMQHSEKPVNEYDDENLFPLLYPTLFPYGTGGFHSH